MPMGHNPNTITAANCVILFRCEGVYDGFVKITGAQTDSFLSFGDVTLSESEIGVDGQRASGFTPHLTTVTLSLAANSPSVSVLEDVYNDHITNMEVRDCEFQVTYPSTKKRRTLKGAFEGKASGSIEKLLAGHTYTFSMIDSGFENI